MPDNSANNKRIAKNTLMLYGRMLFTVGISFYTTRLVLANLGVSDYGLYNVIGGFVNMFYMITSTLAGAISRFLTYDLGVGDVKKLQQTFSTSIIILLGLALCVVILGETIGLWFLNNKLNIDPSRMYAANWVYQFLLMAFLLELLSIPYLASVISHEKMGTFAFVTIAKVLMNFGIALVLSVATADKLILYGILMFAASLSMQLMYYVYCTHNFQECHLVLSVKNNQLKEIFGFAGWNFLSTCASMFSGQGVNILMNMFLGVGVNAANGVASQIKGTAVAFAKNFSTAISPQITKSYARGDKEYTRLLVCEGAKFQFLLLLFTALPIFLESDFILSVWLKEVPPYAVAFVKLTLLYILVEQLVETSTTLNYATGKIRNYQILLSTMQILIFLSSLIALKLGKSPVLVYSFLNIGYALIVIPRIFLNRKHCDISISYWAKMVLAKVLSITCIALLPCLCIQKLLPVSWIRLLVVASMSTLLIGIGTYLIALNKGQRVMVINSIREKRKIKFKLYDLNNDE